MHAAQIPMAYVRPLGGTRHRTAVHRAVPPPRRCARKDVGGEWAGHSSPAPGSSPRGWRWWLAWAVHRAVPPPRRCARKDVGGEWAGHSSPAPGSSRRGWRWWLAWAVHRAVPPPRRCARKDVGGEWAGHSSPAPGSSRRGWRWWLAWARCPSPPRACGSRTAAEERFCRFQFQSNLWD